MNDERSVSNIKTVSNRIYYLDVLRVIACMAVVVIHASAPYVKQGVSLSNFWVGDILEGPARIAVPLFVMISGALMLDENYTFSKVKLIGHIKKLILFFVFWSATYTVVFKVLIPLVMHQQVSITNIIGHFLLGHYHLWYMYLIIGLYLITPLLKLWIKRENKRYVEYFLILAFIFAIVLPQIASIGSNFNELFDTLNIVLEKKIVLKYVGGFTIYYILGWYINTFDIKKKRLIYLLGLLGVVVSIIGTYFMIVNYDKDIFDNLSINVLFSSIAIFLFIKNKFKYAKRGRKFILTLAKYSLGIYAIHAMIIEIVYMLIGVDNYGSAIINMPLMFVISFFLSLVLAMLFSKIPILKRVV